MITRDQIIDSIELEKHGETIVVYFIFGSKEYIATLPLMRGKVSPLHSIAINVADISDVLTPDVFFEAVSYFIDPKYI